MAPCTYTFTKGKNKGQQCGVKGCKKHAAKTAPSPVAAAVIAEPLVACPAVLKSGKNKGNVCNKTRCKIHKANEPERQSNQQQSVVNCQNHMSQGEKSLRIKLPVDVSAKLVRHFDFNGMPVPVNINNLKWWQMWKDYSHEGKQYKLHRWTKLVVEVIYNADNESVAALLLRGMHDKKFIPRDSLPEEVFVWCENSNVKL